MVLLLLAFLVIPCLHAQTGDNVLLVVNRKDATSRQIADYYRPLRSVPPANLCYLDVTTAEEIDWKTYQQQIEKPVSACLNKGLREKILYIVTTLGVPLKISGDGEGFMEAEQSSVDAELALLYGRLQGAKYERKGPVPNPFYRKQDVAFRHPVFPIYLVTRLAANDFNDVKAMIDRSLAARNRGKFVIDLKSAEDVTGNDWLRNAAILLPTDRVVMDETTNVLYGQKDVIAYAAWGSNDKNRTRRWLSFQWLPGAIATEFVSTNGRTMARPPANWNITTWEDKFHFFARSPQSLTADLIHEGATGASGNVYEPFLAGCARPDYVPAGLLRGA